MPSDADPVLYQPKPSSVLMVSEALARGGAERQMFALTHGLLQRGYEVKVFELLGTSAGQASFTDEFLKLGVRVRHPREFAAAGNADDRIILTRIESFAAILSAELPFLCRALTQAVKEIRPDIVHCWSDRSNLIGGFVSVGLHVPRIVFGNRVLPPPFWFEPPVADVYRDAYRALVVEPNIACVSNSSVSIAEFERWLQYPRTPVALVYNGFLPSCMEIPNRSEMEACRKTFGLPANATVVGAIMRLAPEKDPALWIETAAEIARAWPDVHFLLAGHGHDAVADKLRAKGTALGLNSRLVMPGAVTEIGKVYGAMDVLLMTSRLENVPNVIIEAQACGLPIVAPAIGGIGEAMLDGLTGVLVRERTAPALAAAVLDVLGDARLRERAAVEGPAMVAKKFGQERMMREMLAIYRDGAVKA